MQYRCVIRSGFVFRCPVGKFKLSTVLLEAYRATRRNFRAPFPRERIRRIEDGRTIERSTRLMEINLARSSTPVSRCIQLAPSSPFVPYVAAAGAPACGGRI